MSRRWMRSWLVWQALLAQAIALHTVFRTRRQSPEDDPVITLQTRQHYPLPDQWFRQRFDHLRPDNRTWYQRYWTQNDFYIEGGPVFMEVTGEWMADGRTLSAGFMVEQAKKYNALMFLLEHRFYGNSRPTTSLNVKSLKYLSSEQALADAAHFIGVMNKKHELPEGTKWIVFGGSYAGNLVTWLRDKYPDVVYGAVASSAPLLAQLNFPEFLDEVRTSLASHSQECAHTVEKTFQEISNLLKNSSGQNKVIETFGLCGPLNVTDTLDSADLIFTLADELPLIVEGGPDMISDFCTSLGNSSSKGLLARYAAAVDLQPDPTGRTCTTTDFESDVKDLARDARNIYNFSSTEYQWLYQMCSEFGYFTTSESPESLLGAHIPVQFFVQQCLMLFGKRYTLDYISKRVDRTNKIYGGRDLNATRVIHVHGGLDPWRVLGITETRNPLSPAILIPGASHCTVDWSTQEWDPPELTEGRRQVSDILGQWLAPPPVLQEQQLVQEGLSLQEEALPSDTQESSNSTTLPESSPQPVVPSSTND